MSESPDYPAKRDKDSVAVTVNRECVQPDPVMNDHEIAAIDKEPACI